MAGTDFFQEWFPEVFADPGTSSGTSSSGGSSSGTISIPENLAITSGGGSSGSSSSSSSQYTGLPQEYRDKLLANAWPLLRSTMAGNFHLTKLDDMFNQWAQAAKSKYSYDMQDSLANAIPQAISNQANKGVLSSSFAENALSNVATEVYKDYADKIFEADTQAMNMKARLPEMFANIMGLGKYSEGQSSSSSTQSSNQFYEDPVSIYGTIGSMLF